MKKICLGIVLGLILSSGLRTYYNYQWWTTEATVSDKDFNESVQQYGYAKIIQDRMGISSYFKYLLISGDFHGRQWTIGYP